MRIYKITTTSSIERYIGWKVPLLLEAEQHERAEIVVTDDELTVSDSETRQNETDAYDGSDRANWNTHMTNISDTKQVCVDEFENVYLDDNPSRFCAMYNALETIPNPQTEKEIASASIIEATLKLVEPYIGKQVYIGKQGRCHYFMKPERSGNGIKMNCRLTWSPTDK